MDLTEANERVAVLERFPFEDQQPSIEGQSPAITYDAFVDYNFADRNAFDTRWTEETQSISQLREVIKQGDFFVNMLYTYRSCSKALPTVKTAEQANRNEIYEGTYEVLEPEIKKLKTFMYFQRDTIKLFCEHVKRLAAMVVPDKKKKEEGTNPSETYVWYMIQLLDRFALLDALKNMKACLNNDFSFYKRAFGFLRNKMSGTDDQTQENHTLYLFLAHQNSITTNIRTEVQAIAGFDDVLSLIANTCADFFEADRFVLPGEKHCLLRVMPYVLYLMDGEQNSPNNIFKSKKIKLERFSKIFRKYPVVPLYGDMQITLESTIRRSPHFDEKVWGSSGADTKLSIEYEVVNHLETTRTQYNEYIAKFAGMVNEIRALKRDNKPVQTAIAFEVTNTVLQGIQFLSDWTAKVLQQSAWKYARPNNDPSIQSQVDYERVIRYNYKLEEKFALIEFIGMIKGLSGLMLREDSLLSPIIRTSLHDELQEFIQIGLRDLIRTATKKKKKERTELMQMRFVGADWLNGVEPDDPVLQGKKPKEGEKVQLASRSVAPSPTQLVLIRNTAFGLLSLKKTDFSSAQIKTLETFYQKSFFYEYLLNYTNTIQACSDLGDLWYREFYLELSKRLQFPIDMSLPWILTDSILESKEPSMLEFLFYPLDLYNDSAYRALNSLTQQFLYDEIEAEVNLCFDQLVYKLSEQMYTYFKTQASSLLLDKPYKGQLETIYPASRLNVPKSRYEVILRQRHIQLLGRSVDLNLLIAQRMNTYLRQNLDFVITRFEASDITGIVELQGLIENIHLTYDLLRQYIELDPWDSLLKEVNESTSLVSFHGRIVLHIIFELVYDFAPNFNYNSITNRFVRTPLSFSDEVPRDAMPKTNPTFLYGSKVLNGAYANSSELYKKFVGTPHIDAIVNLVGTSNLPLIVSECIQNMDLKLRNVLVPYVRELMGGMPPNSKLPIHDYGTEGGFGYFQLKLKDIITYPDLQSEVLQNFREVGNLIIFLKMIDLALTQQNIQSFIPASAFLGITPIPLAADQDPSASSPLYTAIHGLVSSLESRPALAKSPAVLRDLVSNSWKADKLYRPTGQNFSLFKSVLSRISSMLDAVRGEWTGANNPPENHVMNVDHTTEFYRLWSALQFVCCLPTGENELSNHELFGDGLLWAGITFIHFLGQKMRFETFDFSYHILNVEDSAAVACSNPSIHQFFKKVALFRDINQCVFNTLQTYLPFQKDRYVVLSPPQNDQSEKEFIRAESQTRPVATQSSYPTQSQSTFSAPPPISAPPVYNNNEDDMPPPPPDYQYVVDDQPPPPPYEFDAPPPIDDLPPPPPPRD